MEIISDLTNNKSFRVVGVMSGTSLDGLDICLCTFIENSNKWSYKIEKASTVNYSNELKEKLSSAFNTTGNELTKLDYEYGRWIGNQVKVFLKDVKERPSFVASHGHTIFHNPNQGYTLQIGKGSAISAETSMPCICDFRSSDVGRSGQGAPLVPIGDRLLFSDFDICLNLGGFANLSFENENSRLAFDIGPCNIILNKLAQQNGLNFDKGGDLGGKGKIDYKLLEVLNALDYYQKKSPKSLGREWVDDIFYPLVKEFDLPIGDKLRTVYEHIATQISIATNNIKGETILVTGGGTHNNLLIHLLKNKSKHSIVIPDIQTIDYKEALIFGFLGVLYIQRKPGALSSVTGAVADSISGCLYF